MTPAVTRTKVSDVRLRVWLGALLVAAYAPRSACSAQATLTQSYDVYGSWLVACDNTLTCVAKGLQDGEGAAEMSVSRAAGPAGSPRVTIRADSRFGLGEVRLDGSPLALSAPAWTLDADDEVTTLSSHQQDAVRALLRRVRNGATLTLGGGRAVPLDGFSAALLRIDERQGRIGTVTALARPGPSAAAQVPATVRPPRVAGRPITVRLAPGEAERLVAYVRRSQSARLAREDCEPETLAKPEAHALSRTRALVLIPCLQGAYQGSSLGFLASRDTPGATLMALPTPYRGGEPDTQTTQYLTEASFDPERGRLSVFGKGRGLADCGMSASWTWDGGAFRLDALALQEACGGVEPGDWPTLFRSTE